MREPDGFRGTPGEWTMHRGHSVLEVLSGNTRIGLIGSSPYWEQFTTEEEADATLIRSSKDLLAALQKSTKALIADRDCLYDSITNAAGEIVDPADGEGLAELDALIDENRAAIAKALQQEGE